MKFAKFAIFLILFTLCVPVSRSQYLSYKRTFFGDLKYTRDGIEFRNFGGFWRDILTEVEDSEQARNTLKSSRNFNYAGQISAAAGGVILGYAAGLESDNKKVDDGYWIAGGGLALTGLICEIVAKYKLDKGFLIYNENTQHGDLDNGNNIGLAISIPKRGAALVYRF